MMVFVTISLYDKLLDKIEEFKQVGEIVRKNIILTVQSQERIRTKTRYTHHLTEKDVISLINYLDTEKASE